MLQAPPNFPVKQTVVPSYNHPRTLTGNPISWYPGLGFYRNKDVVEADGVLGFTVADTFTPKMTRGTTTKNSIGHFDAFSLGRGEGMAAYVDLENPVEGLFSSISHLQEFTLENAAQFGLVSVLTLGLWKDQPEIHEHVARSMCAILARGLGEKDPWTDYLSRFAEGKDTPDDRHVAKMDNRRNPHSGYSATSIASDTIGVKTDRYFGGLKRIGSAAHGMKRPTQKKFIEETLGLFEALAVEHGASALVASE